MQKTNSITIFCFFLFFWVSSTFSEPIKILLPLAVPSNDDPCNSIGLPVSSSCTMATYTNASATATSGPAAPTCGFYQGGDVWFSIIIPASGSIQIQTAAGVITDGAMAVYTGTCSGGLTPIGCDDDGGPGLMPQLNLTGLIPGNTIFVRFWEYGNDNNGTFQICVMDLCPGVGPPANDYPCNAQSIQLGVYTPGSITICASALYEPATPACWTNGGVNTVWYSVIAASPSLRIRCNPVTLTDPQIALYSGICGPGLILKGCNDNGASCGSISLFSDLTVAGLTIGQTYYIAVDGYLDLVGSFNLLVIDGTQPLPPIPGQDCGFFQPVCGQSFTVGNPGFTGVGNVCDFDGAGANCLDAGERASAWYEFTISANGILEFNIVPNNWPGAPSTASTDYDFALWKSAGTGAVSCVSIAAGAVPLRCNFSYLGVTGIYSTVANTSPPAYPGFGAAYDTQVPVSAGDKYILVISNYSTSSSGFNLNFSGASPITYGAGPGSTAYWSGSAGTDWFNINNWGGCAIPTCSTNAVIVAGISNQPVINATANCQSLTVNPGASLTLQATAILNLCGDYLNNGSLNANPAAQVILNNSSVVQNLSGNMIGNNAFPILKINKTGGSGTLIHNLNLKSSLQIMSASSVFDAGTKTVKIAGDFLNNAGGSYSNAVPGLLEFNGITTQWFYNSSNGTMPNVRMNNRAAIGLQLQNTLTLNPFAKLTLDSGIVRGNGFEVVLLNRNSNASTPGNSVSYIENVLSRYINPTGSYDFPVGTITKGFQRININFAYPAYPTLIDNLAVNFSTYATPSALGVSDCGVTFSNPGLDNGFWAVNANANSTTGKFDLTLNNAGYSNASGSNGWTIMSNNGSGWSLSNGTCVPSPVTAVTRIGMSGVFNYATAQSPSTPLPVTWLYFTAKPGDNLIKLAWATASEDNNDGFEVYRSTNQYDFEKIGWVDGNGNSNVINAYGYIDKNAKPGINYYYRLHQIDFNGNYEISKTVTARLNYHSINIIPNPVLNQALVSFYSENKNIRLDLLLPTGELVKTLIHGIVEDENQNYFLDPEKLSLAPGCYLLRLIEDDSVSHVVFCYIR